MGRHSSKDNMDKSVKKSQHNKSENSSSSCDHDGRSKQNDYVEVFTEMCKQFSASSQQFQKVNIRPGDEGLIPYFDPAKHDITVEQWIKDVDQIRTKFVWDDCTILRLIVSRLQGHAKRWYNTRHCITASWTETKAEMIKTFSRPLPFAQFLKEAVLYYARPGQDLGDYCLEKMDKWKKLNIDIPDKYLIDLVIEGIKNKNLARIIRTGNHTDVNSFYNYIQTLGLMPNRDRYYRREDVEEPQGVKKYKADWKVPSVRVYSSIKEEKENILDNDMGMQLKCFKCREGGHFAKQCTKRRGWGARYHPTQSYDRNRKGQAELYEFRR